MDWGLWLNRALKTVGILLGLVIIAIVAMVTYAFTALPKVAAADPALKIAVTPARLKRGEYLAKNVAGCMAATVTATSTPTATR